MAQAPMQSSVHDQRWRSTGSAGFSGKDSILSGPAGGVVGAVHVAREVGFSRIIGFDMGGTSTDVSRFDGEYERRYEMELSDPQGSITRIVAPMLAVETGRGGWRLDLRF
jgi:5-oxoprolinase (ATP-hydrolysing)